MEYIKSPLNYVGGKTKLLSQILPLFPKDIRTFYDVFCGGCNVGINVEAERVVCNDIQTELIDLYIAIQRTPLEDIRRYIKEQILLFGLSRTNKEGYISFRKKYNDDFHQNKSNPIDLLILISHSFNNQLRFNKRREYSNTFGRRTFNTNTDTNLELFKGGINQKNILFTNTHFSKIDFSDIHPDDFVYFDPPYTITEAVYNKMYWSSEEDNRLMEIMSDLNKRGIRFAMSNVIEHSNKTNDKLIKWVEENNVRMVSIEMSYANAYAATKKLEDRVPSKEVLIINYDPPIKKNIQSTIF